MGRLDGKVAVVTGGGRGLGRSIVSELVRHGAAVVVNDLFRDESGVSAADLLVAQIQAAGGRAVASYDSVAAFESAQQIIDTGVAAFGRIDTLVNCAGNWARTNILEIEEDEWDSISSVHLDGHAGCTRAAINQLLAQGSPGRIITVSSRGSFWSQGVAYAAAKAGIMGLTASLSAKYSGLGITVNCVLPSAVTQLFPSDASTRLLGGMPASTDMDPDCVAPLVAFLCTDAADAVTGRYLYSSGGDICVYTHPMMLVDTNVLVRNTGRWTLDQVTETLPPLLGVQ